MIKLTVFGSSSDGNSYLLETSDTKIILDIGVKHINNEFIDVDGILISHRHLDHCGGVKHIKNYYKGKYYSHKDVLDILPIIDNYKVEVKENERFDIKSLSIIPFSLVHDVPNMGYLIKDNISGYKIIYITDTGAIDHLSFKDIDCFLCESNCDEDELNYEDFKEVRVYDTHLSMQQTATFLNNNVNHNTKHCILCHISSSEEDYMKHQKYISGEIDNKNIKIIAIDPKLKEPLEIILKEDIGGFDFE